MTSSNKRSASARELVEVANSIMDTISARPPALAAPASTGSDRWRTIRPLASYRRSPALEAPTQRLTALSTRPVAPSTGSRRGEEMNKAKPDPRQQQLPQTNDARPKAPPGRARRRRKARHFAPPWPPFAIVCGTSGKTADGVDGVTCRRCLGWLFDHVQVFNFLRLRGHQPLNEAKAYRQTLPIPEKEN